ncbi:raftlin-like [Sardina pilchardus]|uniref:raftlin-like n=1 Tax=Sardina pilchardus TaxID=27697 RepID=UPI002E0FD9CE
MGCGLRKLRQSDDGSPGKIYSTLKRPQVETKVGVAYTYRHLDFLVGKDDGTSTLQLSSVRELPAQVLELYQQGFVLAAVHPFVHPCGPEPAKRQRQLYRAVLVRLADSVEKSQSEFEPCSLRLEECLSAERFPSAEHIQGYVKKQIQDAADQGIMFVGFIQEPGRVRVHLSSLRDTEEPSLSLHSSPSSLHSSGVGPSPSPSPLEPTAAPEEQSKAAGDEPMSLNGDNEEEEPAARHGSRGPDEGGVVEEEEVMSSVPASPSSQASDFESPTHNNNDTKVSQRTNKLSSTAPVKNGMELFALYNQPCSRETQVKFYTVKVPLRVQPHEEGVPSVEANWLDHMTQHFNNGASLVDGYFHLGDGDGGDSLPKLVESVFIFQEGLEGDSNTATAYDAIVVEQWTIIDGVQVKTDYIPLLQSLALYGWRLTCVLPTPIVKTNSDGSLCTKQIVFLQRPVLPRKKRESKKLIFKARNKSNKNSIKDAPKDKKKNAAPLASVERELDDQRISDGVQKVAKEKKSKGAREEKGGSTEPELDDKMTPNKAEAQTTAAKEEGGIETAEGEVESAAEGKEEKGGEAERKEEAEEGGEKEVSERNNSRASTEPETNGETQREGENGETEREGENGDTEREGENGDTEREGENGETEREGENGDTEREGENGETEREGENGGGEAEDEGEGEAEIRKEGDKEERKEEGGEGRGEEQESALSTQVNKAESDPDTVGEVAVHPGAETLTNGSIGEGPEEEDKMEVEVKE